MTDSDSVKTALAALADGDGETQDRARGGDWTGGTRTARQSSETRRDSTGYRAVVERAIRATDDLEAAATFAESTGVDALARAVERAEREVSGLADEGRLALTAFEEFRAAAADGGPDE
ncbi:hypothetical protein EGH21_02225 [Halomicroarcula sp. F13]|uniref:Uncharacterized protein n=1 Tax=Haloarcula rubra TaxID=2487747 RepID=A0AAW4PMK2_9EURY|nr:hypothetical protein [Halomicroarcula rubra]MBX0321840.1 hypothetical protein [Halomicroarcula rubra]